MEFEKNWNFKQLFINVVKFVFDTTNLTNTTKHI